MKKDYTYNLMAAADFDHWLNYTESIYNKYTSPAICLVIKNGGELNVSAIILIYSAVIRAYKLMRHFGGNVDALMLEDIEAILQNYRDYVVGCAQDKSN